MAEVLCSPPSSSSPTEHAHDSLIFRQTSLHLGDERISVVIGCEAEVEQEGNRSEEQREKDRRDQLSLLAILVTLLRKSFLAAWKRDRGGFSGGGGIEIGWPTDVQHVSHVTFDRFDGFLGLPVEFELEVPRRAPSASATVFGVSTKSMQLSYDHRGNIIPTILLLMQRHLYFQGGLQAEGIFRITAGNSHEEFVRNQLNRGVVPEDIDIHCLAGLIKAWFRELPIGVLDSLSPDDVMQCQTEDEFDRLVKLLPPTESALLDWAVNLMADVVQEERLNKMNARNIAMVFAPNMTKMSDPLNALMYVVQVMNFLKALIEKTLRERQDKVMEEVPRPDREPSDDSENQCSSKLHPPNHSESNEGTRDSMSEDHRLDTGLSSPIDTVTDDDDLGYSTYTEESDGSAYCETPAQFKRLFHSKEAGESKFLQTQSEQNIRVKVCLVASPNHLKLELDPASNNQQEASAGLGMLFDDKSKSICDLIRISPTAQRFETWR